MTRIPTGCTFFSRAILLHRHISCCVPFLHAKCSDEGKRDSNLVVSAGFSLGTKEKDRKKSTVRFIEGKREKKCATSGRFELQRNLVTEKGKIKGEEQTIILLWP